MGIEIRSTKEAEVAAKTGTMIGEAQRRAVEWEMQKATLRSQQEFQQELRPEIVLEKFAVRFKINLAEATIKNSSSLIKDISARPTPYEPLLK